MSLKKSEYTDFPSNLSISYDTTGERAIFNALSHLQNLNLTDKDTLQQLACFAQYDNPEIMAELLSILSKKLSNINNKWVFAAISFSLWTSTLSTAQHFVKGHRSLPVNLLEKIVSSAKHTHIGSGPDWDQLYLSLTAINACVNVIQSAMIDDIDSTVYTNTVNFLKEIEKITSIPPTLIFLVEQTLEQLSNLKSDIAQDSSKNSIKNEASKAFLNIGLSALYMGAGITSLIAATSATAATAGGAAPIMTASVFSFALLVGLSGERAFTGLKNLKSIKGKISERHYVDYLKELITFSSSKNPESQLTLLFDTHFSNLIKIMDDDNTPLLKLKQVLFSLFQILRYDLLNTVTIKVIFNTIKAIYKKHSNELDDKASVNLFLLEQVQQLKSTNHFKNDNEKSAALTKIIIELSTLTPDKHANQTGVYLNSQPTTAANSYYDVDFRIKPLSSLKYQLIAKEDIAFLETMGEENQSIHSSSFEAYQMMLIGLVSQRTVNKIDLHENDEVSVECAIVPANPNGDCGFMAISRCLELTGHLHRFQNAPLTRQKFIQTVTSSYLDNSKNNQYEKSLIDAIMQEDKAKSLKDWQDKFTSTSIYVGEPHLRFIAYYYGLSFTIFILDDRTNQFKPAPLSNEIIADINKEQPLIDIKLAHLVAGERTQAHYPNHFEGIIINPMAEQKEKIAHWLKETTEKEKELEKIVKQHLQPAHVVRQKRVDHHESIINDYKDLRQNSDGMVDKTSFIFDFWQQKAGFSLLRPRRFGKSMTLSMCNYFFSVRHKNVSELLFQNLNIAKYYPEFYQAHRGRYPVITIDLKDIVGNSFEISLRSFQLGVINPCYKAYYSTLLKSSALEKEDKELVKNYSNELIELTQADLTLAIKKLSELLYQHYKQKVIILVDEYDSPLIKAKQDKDFTRYSELKTFIGNFFSTTFKGNECIEKFFFTGIMDAKGTGIFSELNSIKTFTLINDPVFAPYLGFSEKEVIGYLKQNGLVSTPEILKKLKNYYNGYVCLSGEDMSISSDLFNIYSIVCYIQSKGHLESYWLNSSSSHQLFVDLILGTHDSNLMQQVLNLMGDYPIIRCYSTRPDTKSLTARGIYFYQRQSMDAEPSLEAYVLHQHTKLANNAETIKITALTIPEKRYQQINKACEKNETPRLSLDEHSNWVYYTKKLCQDPAKTLGFRVRTQLSLQNLKFLDSNEGNTAKDIYGLLFYAGYLTFTGKYSLDTDGNILYELKIPNTEIRRMFNNDIKPAVYKQYQQLIRKQVLASQEQQPVCIVSFAKPETSGYAALSVNYTQKWMNLALAKQISNKIANSYAFNQNEDTIKYQKSCISYIEIEITNEQMEALVRELNDFVNKILNPQQEPFLKTNFDFTPPIQSMTPIIHQLQQLSLSETEKTALKLTTSESLEYWKSQLLLVKKLRNGEEIVIDEMKNALSYFRDIIKESSSLAKETTSTIQKFIKDLNKSISEVENENKSSALFYNQKSYNLPLKPSKPESSTQSTTNTISSREYNL